MKLAVQVGTVGDGSVKATIQYCRDMELNRLIVPFRNVKGYGETGVLDPAHLKEIRHEIEDAGMSFSGMVDWANKAMYCEGADGAEGAKHFDHLRRNLDTISQAGARELCYFAIVPPPQDPKDAPAQWDKLIGFWRKFMAHAEQCGVRIGLHTVADPEKNLLWDYKAVQRLQKDAPSPSNGVTLCIGNFWNSEGEAMYDVIRRLGEKIFIVHVRSTKQGLGETAFWFDSGGPDFRKTVRALRDINYQGDLRSEHMPHVAGGNRDDIGTAWAIGYMKAMLQYM